jgi:hypothetical protein
MICCGCEARESHSTRNQGGMHRVRWGLRVVFFSLFSHISEKFQSVRASSFFELDLSKSDLNAIYILSCCPRR